MKFFLHITRVSTRGILLPFVSFLQVIEEFSNIGGGIQILDARKFRITPSKCTNREEKGRGKFALSALSLFSVGVLRKKFG